MKRLLALCLLALALPALAGADAPFLWEIHGAKARHYLLGSVHLLPASAHPLPPALETAYTRADGVVFESDLAALADPRSQMAMLAAASAPGGLRPLIGAELYGRLQKRAEALGMPLADTCDRYKPWFCAMTLEVFSYQRAGFRAEYGLDQHFFTKALNDGKPIRWLEEPEEHLALFERMPDKLGQQFLSAALDEQTESGQSPEDLLRIWREGDVAALERVDREMKAHHPQAYARLLADRSRAWLPRLEQLLASEHSQLIVVGAAHNAGADGLPALLKAHGYEVQALTAEMLAAEQAPAP